MKKLLILLALLLGVFISFGQQLDNQFYFRFGYSLPTWSQFGMTKNQWDDEGLNHRTGASFELGNIFMVNSILKADNMAFGINVDYLYVNYNNFSTGNSNYNYNLAHVRVGSKVGPSFTYSPIDKLEFDIYAKADFAWAAGAVMYEDEIGDADDYYTGYTSVGFSTGLNVRYGVLILGFEFDTVSPKLESDDYPGEYLGNADNDGDKSPLPCLNFTIGLSF
ncbi:hypothetical protein OU798_07720 [Prolixibacteraceae bacterium Z1-6]|uniref:Outer membrane protein beta-barrel domain-containing protein n=1 Tax=Draconibacterium aestuarii TaxID=2998507 RepID=A0A9X3J680_9BACT|nr:hypothetical protein [Prolixibacteraceae bacterium Z1-6]